MVLIPFSFSSGYIIRRISLFKFHIWPILPTRATMVKLSVLSLAGANKTLGLIVPDPDTDFRSFYAIRLFNDRAKAAERAWDLNLTVYTSVQDRQWGKFATVTYKMETRKIVHIQLFILLSGAMLYFAKPVLMPLAIAGMFALVFMPLCRWLEKKGCHTVVAALICGLLFALLVAAVILFVVWHVQHIATDFSDIRQHFTDYLHGFRKYLHDRFGMDTLKKDSPLPIPVQPNSDGIGKMAASFMGVLLSFVIDLLLILVYMIMLLCLRQHIRTFVLRTAAVDAKGKAEVVLTQSAAVVQQYLRGLSIVIFCLWIMYSIGFTLVGVNTPIFFAILCGILEIIPFVGNITGSTLTCLMALSQGSGFKMVLGVLITYMLIQAIQFYIISPLVMQTQVSIHPLFTIVVLFAGDLIWGIPGMILAIPVLGIVKIVCDHIESLQAIGNLLGENRPVKRWAFFRRGLT